MKNWEFSKVTGSEIAIDERLSDMMGIVEGGCVYSTLFEYNDEGPKKYEVILSMYPQENYRTLTNITLYMKDVPGSSAQAAHFLGDRGINILNSISLDGISDTIIIWKVLADLSFAGEMDLLLEKFASLKESDDPSVSLIDHIEIKPADIGRVFRTEPDKNKTEVRRGAPVTLRNGKYDMAAEYGDILGNIDGKDILMVADIGSWMMSVTFFKERTIYYAARAIVEQGLRGREWEYDIKAVYLVAFMDFQISDTVKDVRIDVALMDMERHTLFSDKVRLVYLQLPRHHRRHARAVSAGRSQRTGRGPGRGAALSRSTNAQ